MQQNPVLTCTIEYSGRVNVLSSEIHVAEPFDGPIPESPNPSKFQAIWDTGATNTFITERVVQTCNLHPTGMTRISTADGDSDKPTFLLSLWLPNKLCIPHLKATQVAALKDADVLIGMDVISQGDFAVTYKNGNTRLSFRVPSIECIDFTEGKTMITADGRTLQKIADEKGPVIKQVGRNDPCPCGSGKKYKRCHGQ